MKSDAQSHHSFISDRRRSLAPRTSEEEALFLARKYYENKTILEAKLANAINGGRFLRMNLLDMIAVELSTKFNVANRNRKYVEQKLRDMKKEARKYFCLVDNYTTLTSDEILHRCPRVPPEPVKLMMQAMAEDHMAFDSSAWEGLDGQELKQETSQETETQSEDSLTFNEYQQTSEFSLEHDETRPIDIILEAATSSTNNHERQNLEHQNISSQKFSPNKILPPGSISKREKNHTRCHKPILSLRRRLLEEKIAATKSLSKMCEQITKSVQETASNISEAYRAQAEYFKLQMAMTGVTIENINNKNPLFNT
uniref:Uncharacterized protein n=1 Tax=Acrobeloides nanus TaxID=290746 RepID=A0A914EMP3_9BILA